jgi:hypothetical protein
MPKISKIKPHIYERYFLQYGGLVEEKIQKTKREEGDTYEYEIKTLVARGCWRREKIMISKEKYDLFLQKAPTHTSLFQEKYFLKDLELRVSIKVYQGIYKGLVFAEVEFDSKEESEAFRPYEWMGKEITASILGRETSLITCNRKQFLDVLRGEEDKMKTESVL